MFVFIKRKRVCTDVTDKASLRKVICFGSGKGPGDPADGHVRKVSASRVLKKGRMPGLSCKSPAIVNIMKTVCMTSI